MIMEMHYYKEIQFLFNNANKRKLSSWSLKKYEDRMRRFLFLHNTILLSSIEKYNYI